MHVNVKVLTCLTVINIMQLFDAWNSRPIYWKLIKVSESNNKWHYPVFIYQFHYDIVGKYSFLYKLKSVIII